MYRTDYTDNPVSYFFLNGSKKLGDQRTKEGERQRQKERETDRQKERERETERDRERERERETERDRERGNYKEDIVSITLFQYKFLPIFSDI